MWWCPFTDWLKFETRPVPCAIISECPIYFFFGVGDLIFEEGGLVISKNIYPASILVPKKIHAQAYTEKKN